MEYFEQKAIDSFHHKQRYVNDTFVIWNHLNAQYYSIQFTIETEQNRKTAFMDVIMRSGRNLSHTVYRKPTHTGRYLHALSNHHPSQKHGIITLTECARKIHEQ